MDKAKMTLKQAMDFLGIKSRITMRKYADSGDIPSTRVWKFGGRWRVFKKSDLIAFRDRMVKDATLGMSYLPLEEKPKKRK